MLISTLLVAEGLTRTTLGLRLRPTNGWLIRNPQVNSRREVAAGRTLLALAIMAASAACSGAETFAPAARPQTPQPPFPYESRDVTIQNASAHLSLSCTLIVPRGAGPFPGVLFLSGSGPQDRDESLAAHKPFWVIADRLGRSGIASLRCDDRGVGGSQGILVRATIDDVATDAAAGVRFLDAQSEVEDERIGLIGHSEGGLVAVKAAAAMEEVDYAVLLAAPGVALDRLFRQQQHDLLKARGIPASLLERVDREIAAEVALAKDPSLSTPELIERLRTRADRLDELFTGPERSALRMTPKRIEQGILLVSTPWFRSLVRERPSEYLERLDIPVLALFGGKDLQVAPHANAAALRNALDAAPTDRYTVRVLPDLNHLFQHAQTGAIAEYGDLQETFAEEALDLIVEWIAAGPSIRTTLADPRYPPNRRRAVR